jgi:polysaccharide export outer membrane protein
MRRLLRLALLPLLISLVPGWAAEPATKPAAAAPAQAGAEPGYQVSPEDVLEVAVWREEHLTKQVVVRPDGAFSFPLVGEVQATGRTVEDLRLELGDRLRKYMPDPVVSVAVLKVTGYKIYVIGKVNKPGEFVTGRFVDVLQALAMAGGVTPFAAENDIRILRRVEGREKDLEQNIMLRSGDTVVVP